MKICASTLALPAFDHLPLLPRLREMGLSGIEIAPAHAWPDPACVTATDIAVYRRAAETAGLAVVGLHAPFDRDRAIDLLSEGDALERTLTELTRWSALCRDLGGRTLVLGARWRHGLPVNDAWKRARDRLERGLRRIESHGTVLCLAPLAPGQGDFCATAKDCYMLANALEHPAFGFHVGAAALMENDEMGHATFCVLRGRLDHVHLDEPGLAPVGSSGRVDHVDLRRHLAAISYFDWVSLVQAEIPGQGIAALRRAVAFVTETYLPVDVR